MCGINGIFLRHGGLPELVAVERMNAVLAHRGPDGEGVHLDGPVALGHRRLAIIDLSEAGRQPMVHAPTGTALVFNGEVYNHLELRRDLEARGHVFRSRSDTEAVLLGYVEWGEDVLDRLEGFFALGIWDAPRRRLVLARDALGIKPLFYALDHERAVFSSEIKGLLASGLVDFEVEAQSVSDFCTYFFVPGRQSILRGVRSLGPAEVLRLDAEGETSRRFWRPLPDPDALGLSGEALYERLRETVADCAAKATIADVPVGLLLSGGMDSNVLLHALAGAGQVPETFTVRFSEASYDEGDLAARAARDVGARHEEMRFGPEAFLEGFEHSVRHLDCLNANPGALVGQAFYGLAAQRCKVALVGSGGDELFGGYPTYRADLWRRGFVLLPGRLRRLVGLAAGCLPVSREKYNFGYVARKFCLGCEYPMEKAHAAWRYVFDDHDKAALLAPLAPGGLADPARHYEEAFARAYADGYGSGDASLLADLALFLGENANLLADQLGMCFSLEVRPPLLSRKLVNLAMAIPFREKVGPWRTKAVLRKAYAGRLSPEVLRMPKHGAVAPLGHVFEGMRGEIMDRLAALPEDYFDTAWVRGLAERHFAGREENSYKLYVLLVFGQWHGHFGAMARSSRRAHGGAHVH